MEDEKKVLDNSTANRLIKEARAVKAELRKKSISYVAAAFGLVVALAWNDAVKGLIDFLFPVSGNGIAVKFIYAIFLTAAVVAFIYYLEKIFAEKEEKQ